MTVKKIKEILDKHTKWLNSKEGGECANFQGENLQYAEFQGADLRYANFRGAELPGADFRGADLRDTNLRNANLRCADFRDVNLQGADLRGADLRNAMLMGAKNVPFIPMVCPDEGDFIGWKKVDKNGEEAIVKLLVTGRRSSATGRKCRCDKATVLAIESIDGSIQYKDARSCHDPHFIYRVGDIVEPKEPFCEDRWAECASGIHFFINKQEAVDYIF